MPRLARKYTVVAPNLPGLGDSGLAHYLHGLVSSLGLGSIRLIGHDMGAAVAYAYAAQHRGEVSHLAVVDVMLAGAGFEEFGLNFAEGAACGILRFPCIPTSPNYDPSAISCDDAEEYLRCYRAPGALGRYLAYYRTWLQDAADIKTPSRRNWGPSLERVAVNVRSEVVARCGHWVPEEAPEALSRLNDDFVTG